MVRVKIKNKKIKGGEKQRVWKGNEMGLYSIKLLSGGEKSMWQNG